MCESAIGKSMASIGRKWTVKLTFMDIFKLLFLCFVFLVAHPETNFSEMLKVAENGDSMVRVVVGYSYS